nr:lasso RiPP family leader peptide-containing protein [Mesorhizobium sp. STM 4661]
MTKKQYQAPVLRKAGKLSSVTAGSGSSVPVVIVE